MPPESPLRSEIGCRNPDRPARRSTNSGDPCVMVIFGAAGDLTRRKLIPALCNLASDGLLADDFAIVGVSYHDLTTEALRARLTDDIRSFATVPVSPEIWNRICTPTAPPAATVKPVLWFTAVGVSANDELKLNVTEPVFTAVPPEFLTVTVASTQFVWYACVTLSTTVSTKMFDTLWIATVCVFGPPLRARLEIASVPVQVADIVTVAAVAAAATVIVKAWVFVPPAATATVAGVFGVRPV